MALKSDWPPPRATGMPKRQHGSDEPTDEQLIRLMQSKIAIQQNDAWVKFFERYPERFYWFFRGRGVDCDNAAELVLETIAQVYRAIPTYKHRDGHVSSWLFGIANNVMNNFFSKTKEAGQEVLLDEQLPIGETPQQYLEDDESVKKILAFLLDTDNHRMNPVQRKILLLRYFHRETLEVISPEYRPTFRQIGDELGHPENTIKQYHFRALRLLKKFLNL